MYVAIPIAIAIVFGLFKVMVPHRPSNNYDEAKLELNKKKYALYQGFSILPLFIFLGLIIYFVFITGTTLQNLFEPAENSLIHLQADSITWMFPGMLLAFGLVIIPMDILYRSLLRDEYDIYLEWTNRRYGWDGMRIMKPISRVLTVLGIACFILLLDVSMTLTEDKLFINGFFDLMPKEYLISEIDEVAHFSNKKAPNGSIVNKEQYVIFSKGQEVWKTDNPFYGGNIPTYSKILEHILVKNNLEVVERGTYE